MECLLWLQEFMIGDNAIPATAVTGTVKIGATRKDATKAVARTILRNELSRIVLGRSGSW